MSVVKRGYGYGQSKPLMNYHTQNPDSAATVVTEVGRMSVNEKPPYNGAGAVQKEHAFLEEEEAGVYSGHNGGTMQKHGYGAQKAYLRGSEVGGYYALHYDSVVQKAYPNPHGAEVGGYALHDGAVTGRTAQPAAYMKTYEHQIASAGGQHGGSGALTQEYESDSSEESGDDESDCEEELAYGQDGTGGARHYYQGYKQEGKQDGVVQKHGYGERQHGGDAGGYGALRHESAIGKHGYGGQKAYQEDVGGHDAVHHESTVQKKHAYGYRYGEQKAHQGDVFSGYDDLVQNYKAARKNGYGGQNAYHRGIDVQGHQNQQKCIGIWGTRRRKRWWWQWGV